MIDYKVPAGYTRFDRATTPTDEPLEVLFDPFIGEAHFTTATAIYSPGTDDYPWLNPAKKPLMPARQVFAWRVPNSDLLVESLTIAAGEEAIYDRAIDGLARESIDRAFGGEFSDKPKNVAYVAELFGVAEVKVVEDYTARKAKILA